MSERRHVRGSASRLRRGIPRVVGGQFLSVMSATVPAPGVLVPHRCSAISTSRSSRSGERWSGSSRQASTSCSRRSFFRRTSVGWTLVVMAEGYVVFGPAVGFKTPAAVVATSTGAPVAKEESRTTGAASRRPLMPRLLQFQAFWPYIATMKSSTSPTMRTIATAAITGRRPSGGGTLMRRV